MVTITTKERAYLRGLANQIDAIFQIGKDGINENLIKSINEALTARELIKLRVLETSGFSAREASEEICELTNAFPVQCIGSKLVIYKENKENKKIIL